MTFQPGQSGNPGGRPKGVAKVRELVQARSDDLMKRLFDLALGADVEDRTRLEAIKVLLDRGYGRPAQPVDGDGEGGPVQVVISWMSGVDYPSVSSTRDCVSLPAWGPPA